MHWTMCRLRCQNPKYMDFWEGMEQGRQRLWKFCQAILASQGEILIDGENPFDNQRLTESICLIKEGDNFKKELKVKNVLRIYAYFYPTWDQELADELIREYNLSLNAKVKALSKGMASALGII